MMQGLAQKCQIHRAAVRTRVPRLNWYRL